MINPITKERMEKEIFEEKPICPKIINDNINNVMKGKPLTMPLAKLNRNCEFRKKYNAYFDWSNRDRINKEYREKNKDKMKEYYEKNKDKIAKQKKEYREKNKNRRNYET